MPRKLRVEYPGALYRSSAYLAAPEHRPQWVRVDRLLGEHGLQEDTAASREELERQMEARRLEETDPIP